MCMSPDVFEDAWEHLLREAELLGKMEEAEPKVLRCHKDTVFRMLFRKKKALLNLYNAVNDTHNPNMPLRDLIYVAAQLQKLVPENQLYSSKLVKIPTPRFVVFYNGNAKIPERVEYRLSDMFQKPMERPELELLVTVYNINPGMNEELLEACQLLKEYMLFTVKIRENQRTMDLNTAVNKAVDDCIREGILEDFLREQRGEVIAMSIYEYDQAGHMQLIKEESWEDGRAEGRAEALAEVYNNLLARGYSAEDADAIVQCSCMQV